MSYADRSSGVAKSARGSLPVWTVGIYRRSQRVRAMRWVRPAPEKVAATKANKGRMGVQEVQPTPSPAVKSSPLPFRPSPARPSPAEPVMLDAPGRMAPLDTTEPPKSVLMPESSVPRLRGPSGSGTPAAATGSDAAVYSSSRAKQAYESTTVLIAAAETRLTELALDAGALPRIDTVV